MVRFSDHLGIVFKMYVFSAAYKNLVELFGRMFTKEYMESDPYIQQHLISQLTVSLESLYEVLLLHFEYFLFSSSQPLSS